LGDPLKKNLSIWNSPRLLLAGQFVAARGRVAVSMSVLKFLRDAQATSL
jgi:hypothetical protein